jgi:hypothetical protein
MSRHLLTNYRSFIMNRISTFALALGLAVSTFACGAASEEGASSAAAQTAPAIEPGPIMDLTTDGISAANALINEAATFEVAPSAPDMAPFRLWLSFTARDFYIEQNGDGRTSYYFVANDVEGDILNGSAILAIDESWANPELGSSFRRRLVDAVPATATRLSDIDAEALRAIAGVTRLAKYAPTDPASTELGRFLAPGMALRSVTAQRLSPGHTSFVLSAWLLEGGDIVTGEGTLLLDATQDLDPELDFVHYRATATITNL